VSEKTPEEIRQEFLADLGTISDVAEALDVPVIRMKVWITRRDRVTSPAPLRKFGRVAIYSISEWKAWHRVWTVTRGEDTWWYSTNEPKNQKSDESFY
jgi:hypothetical protein